MRPFICKSRLRKCVACRLRIFSSLDIRFDEKGPLIGYSLPSSYLPKSLDADAVPLSVAADADDRRHAQHDLHQVAPPSSKAPTAGLEVSGNLDSIDRGQFMQGSYFSIFGQGEIFRRS